LQHTKGLDDEKIEFKNEIKELEKKLGRSNISMTSFILSATSYIELIKGKRNPDPKDEYLNHNVLFLEDYNWPERLIKSILEKS
jgi:hypothetical protein